MIAFSASTTPDILPAWADAIEQSPKAARVWIGGVVVNDVQAELDLVHVEPGPVFLPIAWTTPKQQRYYFGFVAKRDVNGDIVPYQRTGNMLKATTVRFDETNFTLVIENPISYATFVIGPRQQQFHGNTGWNKVLPEYERILLFAEDLIIDGYVSIVDFKGLLQ